MASNVSDGLPEWWQAYNVKCIESDSHSANYTIFALDTINAVVNLKQFYLCKY